MTHYLSHLAHICKGKKTSMALTDAGVTLLAQLLVGSGTAMNAGNAWVGVGDSTTAFAAAQTDLQASTNKLRKAMDTSFPTRSTNAITFQVTFGTSDANWHWQEWGTFNAGPTGGTMFTRKVEDLGTKDSSAAWQLQVTVTVAQCA